MRQDSSGLDWPRVMGVGLMVARDLDGTRGRVGTIRASSSSLAWREGGGLGGVGRDVRMTRGGRDALGRTGSLCWAGVGLMAWTSLLGVREIGFVISPGMA